MVYRENREARREVAMIPMPETAAPRGYNNNAFDGATGKADSVNNIQAANKKPYNSYRPHGRVEGAVGGIDSEDIDYELPDKPQAAPYYEVIKPSR